MKTSLNIKDILTTYPELERLADGDQVKRNHPNCPAGRDRKQRLYIKRDGERLLFYCHHCGGSSAKGGGRRSHIRDGKNVVAHQALSLPSDLAVLPGACHVSANAWLNRYDINEAERQWYRIGWSEYHGRVILPVWDMEHTQLLAYQRRRVLKDDTMPKYLTTRVKWVKHPTFIAAHRDGDTLVLVEDILSAIKVNRVAPSAALLGTHMSDWLLYHASTYDNVVVWLDNDNPQVRADQRRIMRRLEPFTNVRMAATDVDPKELDHVAIRNMLQ